MENLPLMPALTYTSACRVLVVDDLPETLQALKGLLSVEGYTVQTAASRAEALELLQRERFHVAVVDIRLDAKDPENRDGFQLMHDIRALDPTTGIIILTVHADIQLVSEALQDDSRFSSAFELSRSLACKFMVRTPESLTQIASVVQDVYDRVVQINQRLLIDDDNHLLSGFAHRLRFVKTPKPREDQLEGEIEELLRKLFSDCERIEVRPLTNPDGGYSRAIVFQVTPLIEGSPGAPLIAKIGEHSLIAQEIECYRQYIRGRTANNRSPVAIRPARRTRSIGGIVYTFVGLGGKVRDFGEFYAQAQDNELITQVISNLFIDTLSLQHGGTGMVQRNVDIRGLFTRLLRLNPAEIAQKYEALLDKAGAFRKDSNRAKFWLADGRPMTSPVDFAFNGSFQADYYESTIHGDLHVHNVLVDRHCDTWLIDFANTGKGPLLQDYATFETSISVEIVACREGRLLFEWAQLLYGSADLLEMELPPKLAAVPELVKAHHAVMTVRVLAMRDRMGTQEQAEKTYRLSLFFTLLRLMTVRFLNPVQRFHALLAASLVADRLHGVKDF